MLAELGVQPITIPLPFRLNHVNCFLAEGENGWTIMDAGLNTETTRETWAAILEKHKISNIIITHYHPDHFGYAGTLQQLTNAKVAMTKTDAEKGLTYWEPWSLEKVKKNYEKCGLPSDLSISLTTDEGSFQNRVMPYPNVDHFLEEGMKIVFGKYEYEVIFTPGHSDGLIVLYNKEKSVLFSTDHILPKITPNISYWFRGNTNPLQSFIDSLEKIKKLDVEYVIPSHFALFQNANKRIQELLDHHEERIGVTYQAIQEPSTIYEVRNKMFGELNMHESRFAIGETIAHLEYLLAKNKCKKYTEDGTWYYEGI